MTTTFTILTTLLVSITLVVSGMMWERWTWLAKAHDDSDHVWQWHSIKIKLTRLK